MANANNVVQYSENTYINVDGKLLELIKKEIDLHTDHVLGIATEKQITEMYQIQMTIGNLISRIVESAPF